MLGSFLLKIRRAETPFYSRLKRILSALRHPPPLRFPRFLSFVGRALYQLHYGVIIGSRWLYINLYVQPLFQARCARVGKRLRLEGMPFVWGQAQVFLGDDVALGGNVSIVSGSVVANPRIEIGDRSSVGWNTLFTVDREVVVEADVLISFDCRIADSDGHPLDPLRRANHESPDPENIRPVRICRYAWIGNGAFILKGVTIGEGAIVGANSMVTRDVPPYAIAFGNPAKVYVEDVRKRGEPAPPSEGLPKV